VFKVGDVVKAERNYRDEQLGHYAPTCEQTITEVKKVDSVGTSGQWVKTNMEDDWIDSAWFLIVKDE